MDDKVLYVFTDGGINGIGQEENVASWAYVFEYGDKYKECSGLIFNTTSNVAEITAIRNALRDIKRKNIPIILSSDSQYCVNSLNLWIPKWKNKNWKTSTGDSVKNKLLWEELWELKQSFSNLKITWIKGHNGNKNNERCDELCGIELKNYKNNIIK